MRARIVVNGVERLQNVEIVEEESWGDRINRQYLGGK